MTDSRTPSDTELVDQLLSQTERLPEALSRFTDCLAKQRERLEETPFQLTSSQRVLACEILAALAEGLPPKELPLAVDASEEIVALAERVRELRERKKAVEVELNEATDQLVSLVGVGATVRAPELRLRVSEPRLSVKVTDAERLPEAFLSLQPDRKAILASVRERAEVPPGAEVHETRATVYFVKPD